MVYLVGGKRKFKNEVGLWLFPIAYFIVVARSDTDAVFSVIARLPIGKPWQSLF